MEIIPLKSLSKNEVDLFLAEIGYYSFFHTEKILNYYFNTYDIDDKSFFVLEGKQPLAFAPLGISQEENLTSLSFSNVACHAPIIANNLSSQQKENCPKNYMRKFII